MLGDGFATIQALYDFLKSTIQKKRKPRPIKKACIQALKPHGPKNKTSWAQK